MRKELGNEHVGSETQTKFINLVNDFLKNFWMVISVFQTSQYRMENREYYFAAFPGHSQILSRLIPCIVGMAWEQGYAVPTVHKLIVTFMLSSR